MSFFAHIFVKNDLRQTKTKMISGYIYRRIHFTRGNASLLIICNYPEGPHVVPATRPCIYLLHLFIVECFIDFTAEELMFVHSGRMSVTVTS